MERERKALTDVRLTVRESGPVTFGRKKKSLEMEGVVIDTGREKRCSDVITRIVIEGPFGYQIFSDVLKIENFNRLYVYLFQLLFLNNHPQLNNPPLHLSSIRVGDI